MDINVLNKLRSWREKQAKKENIESYMVFPNKTIEEIATKLPKNEEELLVVKGVGEKKIKKYAFDLFQIIYDVEKTAEEEDNENIESSEEKIYSVDEYLSKINNLISNENAKIRGEVSSVSERANYLFFDIKDEATGSLLKCFMWRSEFEMSAVKIEEGLEIVVYGSSEIYKPMGQMTFRTRHVELFGEGLLKKAYEELKLKLEAEGLFDERRKRELPAYPQKIGLITSRDGAVIHDFMQNIGQFGYQIKFYDSRVEGQFAVRDLLAAINYFKNQDIEILVIIRGGGSMESLQAFNNEKLVREITEFPKPVLCGIGHDQDAPLVTFACDVAVSTPTAVAQKINNTWILAEGKLNAFEKQVLSSFEREILVNKNILKDGIAKILEFYQSIFMHFEKYGNSVREIFHRLQRRMDGYDSFLSSSVGYLVNKIKNNIDLIKNDISGKEKIVSYFNPQRQLKLGYSIIKKGGKVVKSVDNLVEGDILEINVVDGKVQTAVKKILRS